VPSWPGLAVRKTAPLPLAYARPSTFFLLSVGKDVDARDKPGMTSFADYAAAFRANPALQPADFKAIG